MARKKTPEQVTSENAIVRRAMRRSEWRRPADVALETGFSTAQVVAVLMRLADNGKMERREFLAPRLYVGTRTCRSTRLIVEYRLVTPPKKNVPYPAWMQPVFVAPPAASIRRHHAPV